jgi:alkanesulfonate monooxygenase SsuD/methylene tetrahydromethanopterin reductase-like flavin-dependent oxidoreductase (luciferase family)
MATIGLSAALEQFHPNELLEHSKLAEQYGFKGVMAADHFQPWVPAQGHNAFAYSWMGALGAVTSHSFGPGVTCPTFRTHPSVIAHAAATLGAMYPGRFWLGLGSGELLNENVVGGVWPEPLIRFEMLQEATEIIQKLLSGKETRFRGQYYQMNKVKLWTLPEQPADTALGRPGRRRPDHPRRRPRQAEADPERFRHRGARSRQRPRQTAEAAPDPRQLGRHLRRGAAKRDHRVAERRDELPQTGYSLTRRFRRHGEAGARGEL